MFCPRLGYPVSGFRGRRRYPGLEARLCAGLRAASLSLRGGRYAHEGPGLDPCPPTGRRGRLPDHRSPPLPFGRGTFLAGGSAAGDVGASAERRGLHGKILSLPQVQKAWASGDDGPGPHRGAETSLPPCRISWCSSTAQSFDKIPIHGSMWWSVTIKRRES